jgi:hypothetical protein
VGCLLRDRRGADLRGAGVSRGDAMSECLVSGLDYLKHWRGLIDEPIVIETWNGSERRSGPKDRRSSKHERRWEASRGRRFRLIGRRREDSSLVPLSRRAAHKTQKMLARKVEDVRDEEKDRSLKP